MTDQAVNPKQERVLVERLEYYVSLLCQLMALTGEASHQEALKRVEEAIEFQKEKQKAQKLEDCLTGQQCEILRLAHEGLSSKEMAETLCVSKRTIDYHIANIYKKFGCKNRVYMLGEAVRRGLL